MGIFAATALVVGGGISFTVSSIFMCFPIEKGWDPSVPGKCIDRNAWVYVNTAYNMVADVVVFLLPIPTLWSLQR